MNIHKYTLEPYKGMKTRYHCPYCQDKKKSFTRYIDTETGEHLNINVGRCDRINNCAVHYTPKQYFQDNDIKFENKENTPHKQPPAPQPIKPISYIEPELFKASLKKYDQNNFVIFLNSLFGPEITIKIIEKYYIGTSKHWVGGTIFWQLDFSGKIRTGKVMLYNSASGKRIKEPFPHITWVQSVLKLPDYNLSQCFFGVHLIKDKSKPIGIVESEKTAIIASVYLPQYIWLSSGGCEGLTKQKCISLTGRTVVLFPDISKPKQGKPTSFEAWSAIAEEMKLLLNVSVSDLLERIATDQERKEGLDIADYLIRYDWKKFVQPEPTKEAKQQPPPQTQVDKLEAMINKNPALGLLIDKLGLTPDPSSTEINIVYDDIESTVNAIKAAIKPNTAYTGNDINKLIENYHIAKTIHYNQIKEILINNKVIEINPVNKESYYQYGSTPF